MQPLQRPADAWRANTTHLHREQTREPVARAELTHHARSCATASDGAPPPPGSTEHGRAAWNRRIGRSLVARARGTILHTSLRAGCPVATGTGAATMPPSAGRRRCCVRRSAVSRHVLPNTTSTRVPHTDHRVQIPRVPLRRRQTLLALAQLTTIPTAAIAHRYNSCDNDTGSRTF